MFSKVNQCSHLFYQAILLLMLFISGLLVGCGQTDRPPRPGDYGQRLVNSVYLTANQVAELNQHDTTNPESVHTKPKVGITFDADSSQNPYRFVMVARGNAINSGEVDVRLIGGVESTMHKGYRPELYREEDTQKYKSGETVLLVIPSEPFSISLESSEYPLYAFAELTQRDNFEFNELELQVWQGKGSKYSWIRYFGLLALLLAALAIVYRFYHVASEGRLLR